MPAMIMHTWPLCDSRIRHAHAAHPPCSLLKPYRAVLPHEQSLRLSLNLNLSHTLTHSLAHSLSLARSPALARALSHSLSLSLAPSLSLALSLSLSLFLTLTLFLFDYNENAVQGLGFRYALYNVHAYTLSHAYAQSQGGEVPGGHPRTLPCLILTM